MRLRGLTLLSVVALPWLLACVEEDPAPLFFKIDYQVRCLGCQHATDDPAREIRGLDGERGFAVTCRATRQGGDRIATFSATYTEPGDPSSNYGITIDQVNLDSDDPGSSCRVNLTEGNNSYEGVCAAGDPDPGVAPCKVELELDGDVIEGSVYCDGIPNRSTTTITRYLVAPGEDGPADFEIQGCEGL